MDNTKFIGNFTDGQFKVTLKTRKNPIKLDNTIVPTLLVNRQYESEV